MLLGLSLLLVVVCADLAVAIPLAEYRERVQRASGEIETLGMMYEDEDEVDYDARRTQTLRSVRQLIPPSETVEWNGTTIHVDNAWLEEAVKDYEKIGTTDSRRTDVLTRITERLHALDERLKELETGKQPEASEGKDADRRRLASILERAEYKQQPTEKGALARLWERFLRWLANLFPESKPLEPGHSEATTSIAQLIVVLLALALITYSVWRFGPRLLSRRSRAKRGEKRGARVVLGETLAEDQTASDLLTEAEALARTGNLRAAIRKGYVALLCELGDRKVLSLAQHKTNRDYLRAVEDKGALHTEMQQLTRSFEHHWYGFATATPDDWAAFRTGYRKAVTSDE